MKYFSVNDIMRIIEESNKSEFNAKKGFKDSDEKKINDEAYSETAKRVKNMYGGVDKPKEKKEMFTDYENRGMLNIEYDRADDEFFKRVKSQALGYDGVENEKKHKDEDHGGAEFNSTHYDIAVKNNKDIKKSRKAMNTTGLKSKELAKQGLLPIEKKMAEGKIKQLTFKRSTFLTEGHMASMIPDSYKKEGNRFKMVDGSNNEYLVEWHNGNADVIKYTNETRAMDAVEKMKHLWEYKSSDFYKTSTSQERGDSENDMRNVLNKSRELF